MLRLDHWAGSTVCGFIFVNGPTACHAAAQQGNIVTSAGSNRTEEDAMAERDDVSGAGLKDRASEAVREGADIRARLHDITLEALRNRRFDREGIRAAVRTVAEGAALGAEKSRADLRQALADAFRGMDEALVRSAEAGRAALTQLAATGRDFSDSELKQALASLRKLEDDFLATVGQVADAASEKVAPELRRVLHDARSSGTETGRRVSATLTEFAERFSVASIDLALAGMAAAAEFGARFAQAAGGVLAGMADAMQDRRRSGKESG
jgi:hypothetical protein